MMRMMGLGTAAYWAVNYAFWVGPVQVACANTCILCCQQEFSSVEMCVNSPHPAHELSLSAITCEFAPDNIGSPLSPSLTPLPPSIPPTHAHPNNSLAPPSLPPSLPPFLLLPLSLSVRLGFIRSSRWSSLLLGPQFVSRRGIESLSSPPRYSNTRLRTRPFHICTLTRTDLINSFGYVARTDLQIVNHSGGFINYIRVRLKLRANI